MFLTIAAIGNAIVLVVIVWLVRQLREEQDRTRATEFLLEGSLESRADERRRHDEDRRRATAHIEHLRAELTRTRIQRDVREPAHEVIEYLATFGPTSIADLIEAFDPYIGRRLGDLLAEHQLHVNDGHDLWWVAPKGPPEPTGAPESDSEHQFGVLPPLTVWSAE